jgi:uncharacterized protein (DUF1810 family)
VNDPFDLARFVRAQAKGDPDPYSDAIEDLRSGYKSRHWIWYVFPQVRGLGTSPNAYRYGITGLDEARAYLDHPELGPRVRACCEALLLHRARDAEAILGTIDARKVRSSMTLFLRADATEPVFQQVLDAFYQGETDARTDELLER